MFRGVACFLFAALVVAPIARADGPVLGATEGWLGVASPRLGERFVTVPGNGHTTLETIRIANGAVFGYVTFRGNWGVPAVTYDGSTAGLSANGRVLVLESALGRPTALRNTSSFLVVDTRRMMRERLVTLRGDFLVDAVSPNGRTLYLIQHVSGADLTRYVVRAYDLRDRRLLKRAIADRTQRGWIMAGYPLKRATSADGRWVYTLYQRDGGYPFVHALDTVRGSAHCIGLPWHGSQNGLWNLRLLIPKGGRGLVFTHQNGKPWLTMDTHTFRLSSSAVPTGATFRWWWPAVASAVLAAFAALAVRLRAVSRRSSGPEVAMT